MFITIKREDISAIVTNPDTTNKTEIILKNGKSIFIPNELIEQQLRIIAYNFEEEDVSLDDFCFNSYNNRGLGCKRSDFLTLGWEYTLDSINEDDVDSENDDVLDNLEIEDIVSEDDKSKIQSSNLIDF